MGRSLWIASLFVWPTAMVVSCGGRSITSEIDESQAGDPGSQGGSSGTDSGTDGGGVGAGPTTGGIAGTPTPTGGAAGTLMPRGGTAGTMGPTGGAAGATTPMGGAAGTSSATGGMAGAPVMCIVPRGAPTLEQRGCFVDDDCTTMTYGSCCGHDRIFGVAKREALCSGYSPECPMCEKLPGFQTDTNEIAYVASDAKVGCSFGEPGAGICVSYIDGTTDDPVACGAAQCSQGEMCVHWAPASNDLLPTPSCLEIPPGCGAPLDCACLPPELCGMTSRGCDGVMGRHVYCAP